MTKYICSFFLLIAVLFLTKNGTLVTAADKCKNIDDSDKQLACYQEQIKKTQQDYASISSKLQELRSEKDQISKKISDLQGNLTITQAEIAGIQKSLDELKAALDELSKNLQDRNTQLTEKITLRNKVLRNFTKRAAVKELALFGSPELSGFHDFSFSLVFEKVFNQEMVKLMTALNSEIATFEADKLEAQTLKNELEVQQTNLLVAKAQLEQNKLIQEKERATLAAKESDYEKELKSLSEKIQDLSEKQQQILNQKYGTGNGTVGDYASPTWTISDPPFGNAFAAFSYGAYTHYNGLSQYGARGRADAGQDYKQILKFYYKVGTKEKSDFPKTINVQGFGNLDFQYYLYGIAEMPSDWNFEALKAQAIAARTYAYRASKPICTSDSCQVFSNSKASNPPAKWKKAVDDTKNEILDGDVGAQYSSTTGGYINNVGWDVSSSWPGDAFEKKAKSPWFYWAWYSQNYRFDSSTCGRSHPWLTGEELADILNSWVVWEKGTGSDRDRISPLTTNCWGGNPYSKDGMKSRADDLGEAYSKVTNADTDVGNNGKTNSITFSTDRGMVKIDGEEFKTVFNLRAPGYISIRSRLYEIRHED